MSDELNQPRCWSGPSKYASHGHASPRALSTARCVVPESNHTSRMSVSFLNGPADAHEGQRKSSGTNASAGSVTHTSEFAARTFAATLAMISGCALGTSFTPASTG